MSNDCWLQHGVSSDFDSLMFVSQCFWILMALRTPPRECIFVTIFNVAEIDGKVFEGDVEGEGHTIDEV